MTTARLTLPVLDARIEARAKATRAEHPWWPCGEGCDACCRSLPHLPTITRPEWDRLSEALAQLPAELQGNIRERTRALATATGPVTCPMLDREAGSCLVYAARPIACRTYGFYTERDAGLHCDKVTRAVEEKSRGAVLWGNGEAIADDMKLFGELASLAEWMAH